MKAYAIFPTFELTENDERSRACVEFVTAIVVESLRQGVDRFHFVVNWRDPGAAADVGVFTDNLAEAHVEQLGDADALIAYVRRAVDPFNGVGGTVRSIATCRAVTFGYDGQAFLCLRHEDEPPVASDQALVVIEERPDLLGETDYFDGWIRDVAVH